MSDQAYHSPKKEDENSWNDYWPLISLIFISALAGAAICLPIEFTLMNWMHYFMGIFLCSFAMLKIFNLSGFADGFEMYDIIAKKMRGYAFIYPFIELVLGLAYLSFILPMLTYLTTIIIFSIGILGVTQAMKKGLDINCPCMGSVLSVPLSTVTLTEDIVMVVMASVMFITNYVVL